MPLVHGRTCAVSRALCTRTFASLPHGNITSGLYSTERTTRMSCRASGTGRGAPFFAQCRVCKQPVSRSKAHVCRAGRRPHNANAAAVEPVHQAHVETAFGEIVHDEAERRELERMYQLSYHPSADAPAERQTIDALLAEVDNECRNVDSLVKEAMQIPDLLEEAAQLNRTVESMQERPASRAKRARARGARRPQRRTGKSRPTSRSGASARSTVRTTAQVTTRFTPSTHTVGTSTADEAGDVPLRDATASATSTSALRTISTSRPGSARAVGRSRAGHSASWGRAALDADVASSTLTGAALGGSDSMSSLLKSIGATTLLSVEDEVRLATVVKQYVKLEAKVEGVKQELGLPRTPSMTEVARHTGLDARKLSDAWETGRAAKQAMVTSNLRLVMSVAKKYKTDELPLNDLVSEGIMGLIRATEKFEPSRGFKFSTYAHWWIRQAITRALKEQTQVVRVPSHVMEGAKELSTLRKAMSTHLGYSPSDMEVAAAAGVTERRFAELMLAYRQTTSTSAPVGDDGTTVEDVIEDTSIQAEEVLMAESGLSQDLERLLAVLSKRELAVVRMRYGLDGGDGATLSAIGSRFNVSRERVRQIELKALMKMRANGIAVGQLGDYERFDGASLARASSAVGRKAS